MSSNTNMIFSRFLVVMLWAILPLFLHTSAFADNKAIFKLRSTVSSLIREERLTEAVPILQELTELMGEKFGYDHELYALTASDLAIMYNTVGRLDEAEAILKKSLETTVKTIGPNHPNVSYISNALGDVYFNKYQFNLAEQLYLRAVDVEKESMTRKNPRKASTFANLASIYHQNGNYALALNYVERALEFSSRVADEASYIQILNILGLIQLEMGQPGKARGSLDDALRLATRYDDLVNLEIITLNNLGYLARELGDYDQAEKIFQSALTKNERVNGIEHPMSSSILLNIGTLYFSRNRLDEAVVIYQSILKTGEEKFGTEHPALAVPLFQLSQVYLQKFDTKLASLYLNQAYVAALKAYGRDHPLIASILSSKAQIHENLGELKEAETLYLSSIQVWENIPGREDLLSWQVYNDLAGLYLSMESFELAEEFYVQALQGNLEIYGEKHPNNLVMFGNLAYLSHLNGNKKQSLEYFRKTAKLMRARVAEVNDYSLGLIAERQSQEVSFTLHAKIAIDFFNNSGRREYLDEAFEVVQLAQVSKAGESLRASSNALAVKDQKFASLLREKLAIEEKIRDADKSFLHQLKMPTLSVSKQKVKEIRIVRESLDRSLNQVTQTIYEKYPDLISNPNQIASITQVQNLMIGDEIFVKIIPGYDCTLVFTLTSTAAKAQVLDTTAEQISAIVASLRQGLKIKQPNKLPDFDVALANELYLRLIEPIKADLYEKSHILLDVSGSLNSIPLSILAIEKPMEPINGNYGKINWFGERYSISNVLGVSAFVATRENPRTRAPNTSFLGVGDPKLGVKTAQNRGLNFTRPVYEQSDRLFQQVNALPSLPDTRVELTNMANFFGTESSQLLFGAEATEDNLKQINLTSYGVISFASHALLANELEGLAEPAIVLTPPVTPTEKNNGILTSSEIAQLELNADWVILSACNTAGADNTSTDEAFSGIARSFFYSGAKTLLVSHWPVVSEPTAEFTNIIFKEYFTNEIGKSDAHRRAIQSFLQTNSPLYTHPSVWGPFSIVGDGR